MSDRPLARSITSTRYPALLNTVPDGFYLSYVRTPRTLCQLGTFIPFILLLSTDDPWLSVIPLTIYCDHTYVTFRMHPSCSKEGNPLPYSGHKTEVKTVTVPEAS